MTRFEYMTLPVTTDTRPADLDALGAEGWELAAITRGIAWLKRDKDAAELRRQADRHAVERRAVPPISRAG